MVESMENRKVVGTAASMVLQLVAKLANQWVDTMDVVMAAQKVLQWVEPRAGQTAAETDFLMAALMAGLMAATTADLKDIWLVERMVHQKVEQRVDL